MDDAGDKTAAVASPLIGVSLGGQYKIESIIGEGGMGMIYRGRQAIVDREVAIKFLPQALAQDEINVQRLAREAKALGRLSHANIVTTYDFGFTDKREPYLVFEFVHGESLQSLLAQRGRLPYSECVPMFIQLADAMKYAHANGVVHRDIKPHNIMVTTQDGKSVIKILDFGIAQMKSETQKLTRAGEIWGSPNYMSPEQCVGDPVDHLTDIYSLGIVMYRTLSGVVPNTGKSFAETVSKKLNEPVPFFASLDLPQPLDIPTDLEEIVIKCLRRYPDERYQTMAELKTALTRFQTGGAEKQEDGSTGTPMKTTAVNKPFQGDRSDKTPKNTKKVPPTTATSAAATAASAASQTKRSTTKAPINHGQTPSNITRVILPVVVSVLAVLLILGIGLLIGEKLEDKRVDRGANQQKPASSAQQPPNQPPTQPPAPTPEKATEVIPSQPLQVDTTGTQPAQSPSVESTGNSIQSANDRLQDPAAPANSADQNSTTNDTGTIPSLMPTPVLESAPLKPAPFKPEPLKSMQPKTKGIDATFEEASAVQKKKSSAEVKKEVYSGDNATIVEGLRKEARKKRAERRAERAENFHQSHDSSYQPSDQSSPVKRWHRDDNGFYQDFGNK